MANSNEYMRVYMLDRYYRRMDEARIFLGGKCVRCGTDADLEFDHIDPQTKLFTMGGRAASIAEDKFWAEVKKCQLLCRECHERKTVEDDRGSRLGRESHGTLTSYRYCKCDLCRAAKRRHNREYKRRRLAAA